MCAQGKRVFVSDMDAHAVHELRLAHGERWQEKRREAIAEARLRKALRGEGGEEDAQRAREEEMRQEALRSDKERQRDRAVRAVLSGTTVRGMLGLPDSANEEQIRHAVRLAMRLLHPDRVMNRELMGTKHFERLELAFKKVNNLKDVERIEHWLHKCEPDSL